MYRRQRVSQVVTKDIVMTPEPLGIAHRHTLTRLLCWSQAMAIRSRS